MNGSTLKRILIIQVSRIGDTLFATPAIRTIAEHCPQAHITVLAHPKRAEVLEYLPFIHQLGLIEKKRALFKGWFTTKTYDLAFVFGFDSALVDYALRVAKQVVAFRQDNDAINRHLYQVVERPAFQSEHAVKQLLHLPAALGWQATNLRLAIHITLAEFRHAHERLASISPENNPAFIIGLQVASFPTKSYRDWPIEAFAKLTQQIKARIPSAHFLIFGGKAERERTRWLHQHIPEYSTHLAGDLTLRQTAALMGLSHLYLGIDTGPTHMMSTFNVPMVLMYHCLSPASLTGPLQHPSCVVIDLPVNEQDCSEQRSLGEISVEQVLESAIGLIRQHYPLVVKTL